MEGVFEKITGFLETVGIGYTIRPIAGETFLPGLQLENGKIIIDTDRLLYPGDILHEAGHLATMPPDVRETISDPLPDIDLHRGGEMMAMAWSYAACQYLGIDPAIVFHADGYRGSSQILLQNYRDGEQLGLHMLQYLGMAFDKKRATDLNVTPYPHMISWLRAS